jgi:integrase
MLRFERRFGGVMAQSGLSIYQRNRTDRGWRYQRVAEGRGVKTGRFVGRFYVRPTQADGAQNWRPLTAESFEQAKIERDRVERDVAETTKVAKAEAFNRTRLSQAVENFLMEKRRKNASTIENYTYILNEFVAQADVNFVDEVDKKVFDGYITWLENEKYAAPKTIHNKVMVVTFMLKNAGVLNPSKMTKDLLPVIEDEPAEAYTSGDLGGIFAAMDPEETTRYTFFLITACREAEVAHSQWRDIEMKGNVPHFIVRAKDFEYSDGTDGKFTPKSHERREIPITPELADLLKERNKSSKSEWIFPNLDGDPEGHFLRKYKRIAFNAGLNCGKCKTTRREGRFEKTTVEKSCKTYNEGCGQHYLHRLRKTRATFWHQQGVSLRTIQAYLGHKSLETTQKYLGIQDAAEISDKINKPMFLEISGVIPPRLLNLAETSSIIFCCASVSGNRKRYQRANSSRDAFSICPRVGNSSLPIEFLNGSVGVLIVPRFRFSLNDELLHLAFL